MNERIDRRRSRNQRALRVLRDWAALGLCTALACAVFACAAPAPQAPQPPASDEPRQDASKSEVSLPASGGWRANLVFDNGATGIWTVASVNAYPQFGCDDIAGLDDKGHCWILWSYSGKWTPVPTIEDGEWLDAIAQVDLDPRRPRAEIYVGGKRGNLYQICVHERGGIDCNIVARFPGQEIHWFSAGDLRPEVPGDELLVHTLNGAVHELVSTENGFETRQLGDLGARVRQSVLLPTVPSKAPWIAGATRAGEVVLLRVEGDRVIRRDVASEPMGMGRIALRAGARPGSNVLYATRDDGVVLRFEGDPDSASAWKREIIYAGPQGPRGITAGRFDADPDVETVAVFGYSARVQLLSRKPGAAWKVEDLFHDRDKGHWLSTGEFDGRNGTDEIIASGYGGRIVLLSRPPGYGLPGVATDPHEPPTLAPPPAVAAPPAAATSAGHATPPPVSTLPPAPTPAALRIGVRASAGPLERLRPLSYRGGFETKTIVYETLLRLDDRGRLAPGLAERWSVTDDGLVFALDLRAGRRFHDDTVVDAAAVTAHLRRVMRLPEHAWLRGTQFVRSIEPVAPLRVELRLNQPYPLLHELVAPNPLAIEGPSSFERDGSFARLVGSGPFRVLGPGARGADIAYESAAAPHVRIDLARIGESERDAAVEAVRRGELDAIVDNEHPLVPRRRLRELRGDPRVRIDASAGSCVLYLAFALRDGPTADLELRRRVARAIDRQRLVEAAELGAGTPCSTLFAPCHADWPASHGTPAAKLATAPPTRLTLLVPLCSDERIERLAHELAAQLGHAEIELELVRATPEQSVQVMERGGTDLMVDTTYGLPYDPYILLESRFATPLPMQAAATQRAWGQDPRLREAADLAQLARSAAELADAYARIQALIDAETLLVPLYVPQRLALVRAGLPQLPLGLDVHQLDLVEWLRRIEATRASS
jgi:ABC-type transport system substrate-binding protein